MFVLPQQCGLRWLSASSRVDVAHHADHSGLSVSDGAESCLIVCNGDRLEAAVLDLDGAELDVWLRWSADFHAG